MIKKLSIALCLLATGLAPALTGCGTTRFTDTSRTATEQLLISDAVDEVVSQMDFHVLAGKKVYLEPKYLDGCTDKGYVVSTLRQHLLAHGCLLMDDPKEAVYVVEARSGGVGTDRYDVLLGIPRTQLPAVVPGTPTVIPEIPFVKRTEQKGVAKLAVFAYKRDTGRPVWQSGTVQQASTAKDLWVLGAGPFRNGSIQKSTEFAGQTIEIPFMGEGDTAQPGSAVAAGVPVTQPAVWQEPRATLLGPHVLVGFEEKGPDHKK